MRDKLLECVRFVLAVALCTISVCAIAAALVLINKILNGVVRL